MPSKRNSRVCVMDCKGRDVFVGDRVADSFGVYHEVRAFEEIPDAGAAWIVDGGGERLIPHLCELVVRRGGPYADRGR